MHVFDFDSRLIRHIYPLKNILNHLTGNQLGYCSVSNVYKMNARSSCISVYRHECFARVSVYSDKERTRITF